MSRCCPQHQFKEGGEIMATKKALTPLQKSMARIYANLIKHGQKTIDDVPAALKDEVQKILDAQTNSNEG